MLEQQLAGVWREVLNVERVGLGDNFFELGGDSILSIQVVSRARQLGIHFSPRDLFQHQTVQSLAAVARHSQASQAEQAGAGRQRADADPALVLRPAAGAPRTLEPVAAVAAAAGH